MVYIQKISPGVTESQLAKTVKKHIKLKTCNKMFIMQLRTYAVTVEYKNNRRKCEFFVVLGNGQALLGMPDTATLKIININIDSLEAEDTQKDNCIDDTKVSNAKQEIHWAGKCCTNTDGTFKTNNNRDVSTSNTNTNMPTKYFLACSNIETDKRKSAELTQQIHTKFKNVFNGIGCFEGTFSLQLRANSRPC